MEWTKQNKTKFVFNYVSDTETASPKFTFCISISTSFNIELMSTSKFANVTSECKINIFVEQH